MRSYLVIVADMAPDHYTFSNLSEYEIWAAKWCTRCKHGDGCAIVDAAMLNTGQKPAEWVPTKLQEGPFCCTEFENNE